MNSKRLSPRFSARDRVNKSRPVYYGSASNKMHSPHFVNVDKTAEGRRQRGGILSHIALHHLLFGCLRCAHKFKTGLDYFTGKRSNLFAQMTYNTVRNGAIPDLQDSQIASVASRCTGPRNYYLLPTSSIAALHPRSGSRPGNPISRKSRY